ncbi:hypothetical protein B296_00002950 [Ensete ventricosum]|uniref:Uncharacterized protein n=1 Tax=Ensete ventricosum TaxID=4639 RepID=A0A427AC03_ENSVE|nr:hypothetical protein B296_00002950 [Ensete ventricosum]
MSRRRSRRGTNGRSTPWLFKKVDVLDKQVMVARCFLPRRTDHGRPPGPQLRAFPRRRTAAPARTAVVLLAPVMNSLLCKRLPLIPLLVSGTSLHAAHANDRPPGKLGFFLSSCVLSHLCHIS